MEHLPGFRKAADALGRFAFSDFRIVRELRFQNADETRSGQRIDLVLDSEDLTPNYRLTLAFGGVSGLKIDEFGGGSTRIIGFDIVDIADRQWEGARWEVLDFEHETLSFRASSAEIVSIAALTA